MACVASAVGMSGGNSVIGQSSGVTDRSRKTKRMPGYWFEARRRYFLRNLGRARTLLAENFCVSVQVLNEFANVIRRKMKRPWPVISMAVADLCRLASRLPPITLTNSQRAIGLAERYGYSLYDCLILAPALDAGCAVLLSEDMQDEQDIDGTLTVRNPFRQS